MEHRLDCKGIKCPMPIVRISQQIKKMQSGDSLHVEAMDPAFPADLRAWAAATGNELISLTEGDLQIAVVKKN